MSKQLISTYSFNKAARTVTLGDFATVRQDRLQLIVNTRTGTIIYNFADPTLGGTFATNVVTLAYDTTSMSNGDALMVIYDCKTGDPVYDKLPVTNADYQWGEDEENDLTAVFTKMPTGPDYAALTYLQYHSVTTANLKSAACNIGSVYFVNESSSTRFFQLFNTTSVPSVGNSRQIAWPVRAGETLRLRPEDFVSTEWFSAGAAWAVSTVEGTYQPATATEHGCVIKYE